MSPSPQTTNGERGRAAYEAWLAERLKQPDPPTPRAWDDLTDSTQRHWIKEALLADPRDAEIARLRAALTECAEYMEANSRSLRAQAVATRARLALAHPR